MIEKPLLQVRGFARDFKLGTLTSKCKFRNATPIYRNANLFLTTNPCSIGASLTDRLDRCRVSSPNHP